MTETPLDRNENPAPSNRWRYLLIGSLALNLIFAGLTAGSVWKWRHHGGMGGRGGPAADVALQGFLRTLPKERAKELRQAIKQDGRPDMRPLVNAVRQARRDAAGALAAETFDSAKLTTAFSGIDTAEAATKAAIRKTMIAAAAKMTPAERQALADRWRKRKPHMFEDMPAGKDGPAGKEGKIKDKLDDDGAQDAPR